MNKMQRSQKLMGTITLMALSIFLALGTAWGADVSTTRIKDIARLEGIRNNQLTGMGIVVGLNGTGDSSSANAQMVVNVMAKWGIVVTAADLKIKNVAAVMITANLAPYLHEGDTLDIQVSSIGDAKSLQGGILLQAPLTGNDGKVYAMGQGPVYTGGLATGGRRGANQRSSGTVGIVAQGAIVEREMPMLFDVNGKLRWVLNNPDFTTASRLAQSINENIAANAAKALDMGRVEVSVPRGLNKDPIAFIAEVENLPVSPDGIAKVVINERDGTVVVGDKVRIAPVAVTNRNITLRVNAPAQSAQQPATSETGADTSAQDNTNVIDNSGTVVSLPDGTTIGAIVRALNAVGATPQDIIAIMVAIKNAGALYASLEFQ
jgi:flagellar P-ring protein precursor FlgI